MRQIEQQLGQRVVMSESDKVTLLENIHRMVRDGTLDQDYTIAKRDKNRWLKRDYNIDDAKIREILLDLQVEDFIKAEKSDKLEYPDDVIYVFKKTTLLMPRWQENADYVNVRLYIKIT